MQESGQLDELGCTLMSAPRSHSANRGVFGAAGRYREPADAWSSQ